MLDLSNIYITSYLEKKIKWYLDLKKKEYIHVEDLMSFLVNEQIEGVKSKVAIMVLGKWVQMIAPVLPLECVDSDKVKDVYELALEINHELADTAFEYNRETNLLMISNEQHIDGFVYDVFDEEYDALIVAIKEFYKRLGKIIDLNKCVNKLNEKLELLGRVIEKKLELVKMSEDSYI